MVRGDDHPARWNPWEPPGSPALRISWAKFERHGDALPFDRADLPPEAQWESWDGKQRVEWAERMVVKFKERQAAEAAEARARVQSDADRRNDPYLTDDMVKTLTLIDELYASGAKLWTKEMFAKVEEDLAQPFVPETIELRSMDGQVRPKSLARLPLDWSLERPPGPPKYSVRFSLFQDLWHRVVSEEYDLPPVEWVKMDDDLRNALATRTMSVSLICYANCTLSYEVVKAKWDSVLQSPPVVEVCAKVSAVLEQADLPQCITKVVCFGLGSLGWSIDTTYGADETLCPAMSQHAVALSVASTIGKRLGHSEPLPVHCQDPIYNVVDKRVLDGSGIQVVEGRGALGFTYVDDETVVFSCNPNVPVKQIVADIARPALMLWNEVKEQGEEKWTVTERGGEPGLLSPYLTDHDSPRTRKLVEGYAKFPFPEDRARFGDLRIYVRKDPRPPAQMSLPIRCHKDVN